MSSVAPKDLKRLINGDSTVEARFLLNEDATARKRLRKFEYTSIKYPPPDLVFTDDMQVINTWPEAWHKAVPLMEEWTLLPNAWKKKRKIVKRPPKINRMARVWYNYPGHPQGSQGWHNQRFYYIISGSRVGTILNHNPYQTCDMLYDQLRGAMPNDPVNHHMIRGTTFEPVAMDYMSKQKGWVLLDMPLIHHKNRKDYPILVVSLDRLFAASANGKMRKRKIIVECKCPWEIKESNVTLYNDQMQLQMECVTSYLDDPKERDECECYLWQYRDSSWSGSGVNEYREDKVMRDPLWLKTYWPELLDFDQRVRADRIANDITLEVYNELGNTSRKAYEEKKEALTKANTLDPQQIEEIAREVMVRTHKEAYADLKISRLFF